MSSLVLLSLLIDIAPAQEIAAVGGPCATIASDRKAGLKAAGGATAPACREQITASFDACVKDPDVTDDERKAAFSYSDIQINGPSLYQKQTAAWTEGYGRYTGAVDLCKTEKQKVTDACSAASDGLKTSMKELAQNDPAAGRAFGAGVQSKATTTAILKDQQSIDATAKAQATAATTIDNQIVCLQSQADALSAAVTKLQQNTIQEEQVGADTASNPVRVSPGDPSDPSAVPTTGTVNQPKSLLTIHESSEAQDIAATGLGAVPVVGPALSVGYAAKGGDWAGSTQSALGAVDAVGLAGETAFGNSIKYAGGPIGLFAVTVAAPVNSQSACNDTSMYDPAAKAKGGCSGIPSVSQSSLDSTVFTLSGP